MKPIAERSRLDSPRAYPTGVLEVIQRLVASGHAAYLVGGCVRDRLRGARVEDYDVATSATADEVLALHPRAVPIGYRHGTVMVPTPDGPVDVTTFRAGTDLTADLAHRDFTINAIAFDPRTDTLVDPFGGQQDLAARRLRGVGAPRDRLREDPLRALRAARLAATLDLTPDSEVEAAMAGARAGLSGVARERVRAEIERLICAENPKRGLDLLRRTGIEADLAPGTADDSAAVVAALPKDRDLRLAAWLRGTRAARILARMRFPRRATQQVAHLLRHHPIGAGVNPKRDAAVRRMLKLARPENVAPLCELRRAELSARGPEAKLDRLHFAAIEAAIARVQRGGAVALQRFDLALNGREVMELLNCRPGRRVGQALRFLTDAVLEDPALNGPTRLRELLLAWAAERPSD